MNEVMTFRVDTVSHIPRSVRPLLAQVLAGELHHACSDGLWGFTRLFLFAKSVLRLPEERKRDLPSTLCLLLVFVDGRKELLLQYGRRPGVMPDPITLSGIQSHSRDVTFVVH